MKVASRYMIANIALDVVRIEPTFGEVGLIGYECPDCGYVTSELVQPKERY
jgi:hypothetical protein